MHFSHVAISTAMVMKRSPKFTNLVERHRTSMFPMSLAKQSHLDQVIRISCGAAHPLLGKVLLKQAISPSQQISKFSLELMVCQGCSVIIREPAAI